MNLTLSLQTWMKNELEVAFISLKIIIARITPTYGTDDKSNLSG